MMGGYSCNISRWEKLHMDDIEVNNLLVGCRCLWLWWGKLFDDVKIIIIAAN